MQRRYKNVSKYDCDSKSIIPTSHQPHIPRTLQQFASAFIFYTHITSYILYYVVTSYENVCIWRTRGTKHNF